jgi:hypothetical protein
MRCVVEVAVIEDDLNGQMNRMRAWLDHHRLEPVSFKLRRTETGRTVRVLFRTESEAAVFASEFGGLLLSSSATDAVVA